MPWRMYEEQICRAKQRLSSITYIKYSAMHREGTTVVNAYAQIMLKFDKAKVGSWDNRNTVVRET